jgi:hypothetical protein
MVTRAFWSVAAFCLLGAAVVLTLAAQLEVVTLPDDVLASVMGAVVCLSVLIFAVSKTTVYKRAGFWRETLRPFLFTLGMAGLGCSVATLFIVDLHAEREAELAAKSVLIMASVLLALLVIFGRAWRLRDLLWVFPLLAVMGLFLLLLAGRVSTAHPEGYRAETTVILSDGTQRVSTIQEGESYHEWSQTTPRARGPYPLGPVMPPGVTMRRAAGLPWVLVAIGVGVVFVLMRSARGAGGWRPDRRSGSTFPLWDRQGSTGGRKCGPGRRHNHFT